MKKLLRFQFIFLSFLSFSIAINAQSTERFLVGSAGNTVSNATISVNFSIGEAVVFTAQSANVILTQGFIQPDAQVLTNVQAIVNTGFALECFPNPVIDMLTLVLPDGTFGNCHVELFDLNGKKMLSSNVLMEENNSEIILNTSSISTGVYFIKVSVSEKKIGMMKIIKVK